MSSSAGDFGPGSVVAGYQLERKIGEGGMGVVYEATQISLNRTVALKLVSPEHAADLGFRERFRREGLMQAALDHPHVVTVFEAGDFDGVLFIAMRLVNGSSLKELLLERTLDVARTLHILGPVADALDSAHEIGLIHRDVKPHNVLVGRRDHGFLADFGLTKSRDGSSMTRTGEFVGSLDYVSPEQIRGDHVTSRTDIYALGAVLFECLTGTVPFPKSSDAAVLYAHLSDPPPRATERRPGLPAALDAVFARVLAKDPADRYAHAADLIDAATDALRDTPGELLQRAPPPAPGERGVREAEVATLPPHDDLELRETVVSGPMPAPSPAPEPERPRGPAVIARRRRGVALGATGALAVATVGSYLTGHSGDKAPTMPSRVLSARTIAITAPDDWRHKNSLGSIPGLAFKDPITLEDPTGTGMIAVGVLPSAADRTLLPAALLRRLQVLPRADDPVSLGNVDAYRYTALRIEGEPAATTVYVAPTSTGIVGAACTGPERARRACESIAATLTTRDATKLALGPKQDYARAVDATVAKLAPASTVVRRLREANRPATQAVLLGALGKIYRSAAKELAAARPGPEAEEVATALDGALRRAAGNYDAMAAAASAGKATAYRRARKRASRAIADVRRSLTRLAAFGYGRVG